MDAKSSGNKIYFLIIGIYNFKEKLNFKYLIFFYYVINLFLSRSVTLYIRNGSPI